MLAGMLVSTCWVQLWWAGLTLGAILGALLHPAFWTFVDKYRAWPISVAFIILWHVLSQQALSKWVTPGTEIKRPLLWFYLYALLSTVYFTVSPSLASVPSVAVSSMHWVSLLLALASFVPTNKQKLTVNSNMEELNVHRR